MACVGGLRRLGDTRALRYVGPCRMRGGLVDLGRYPGLVPVDGFVEGELYEVTDPAMFEVLDRFEGYHPAGTRPSLFVRRRIRLYEPQLDAWVYTYNKSYQGLPLISSGSWLRHLRARGELGGSRQ